MRHTFTQRRLEKITIKNVGEGSITSTDHTGFSIPTYVAPLLKAGDVLYVELHKFNHIGGLMLEEGEFLFHRSDEYFTNQLEKYLADSKRRGEERYEANKADYIKRTKELPERYSNRLNRFLNDPESAERFRKEPMGWGYELIICELAVLYEKYGIGSGKWDDEPKEVIDFAKKHGTSGTQHDVARSWANDPTRVI